MSAHGGARAGAGRPKGSVAIRTRKATVKIQNDGEITPLEVMVVAMRGHYNEGRLDQAAAIARDAAPYIHPRLSSITANVKTDVTVTIQAQQKAREDIDKMLAEVGIQLRPQPPLIDLPAVDATATPADAPTHH